MKSLATALALSFSIAFVACAEDKPAEKPAPKEVKIEDITLKIPADWKQEEPSNNLRNAQYEIAAVKGDGRCEMYVSFFKGTGGGVEANIERWLQQFEADGRDAKVVQGTCAQGPYVYVEITGTYNMPVGPPIRRQTQKVEGARMLGVILGIEGKGNYFLRLTGGVNTVEGQTEAFRASFGADAKTEKELEL